MNAEWKMALPLLVLIGSATAGMGVVIEEVRGPVTARIEIDKEKVELSGHIALSLTVEGPERVEVTPPATPGDLLTIESRQHWRVAQLQTPKIENLGGGRQRWRQTFWLRPYFLGPKVALVLAPLKVRAGTLPEMEINWPNSATVEVTTTVAPVEAETLRPVTDVEAVQSPGAPTGPRQQWWIVPLVAIGAILTLLAVVVLVRRGGLAAPTTVHDGAWALIELELLDLQFIARERLFTQLSNILRLFLEESRQVAATRLTTAELLIALRKRGDANVDELGNILERCDLEKFSTDKANRDGSNDSHAWVERAVQFVKQIVAPSN